VPRPGGRAVPIHRLRPNEAEWTPPAVVFLDTETAQTERGDEHLLTLALWCAKVVDRDGSKHKYPTDEYRVGRTAGELADWLDAVAVGRPTLWCYTHNLNFDLTTTRLPMVMVARGWTIGEFSVRGNAPWIRMRKGSKVLTVVDSFAWLPIALGEIAKLVNLTKPPLPDDTSDVPALTERCRGDVDILARAILELMDWWDRHHLGRWTITGAGCGWNLMRHMHHIRPATIDATPALVEDDRLSVRGGRRDAQRYGQQGGGPFVELDFTAAYPTIAANLLLPTRRRHILKGEPKGGDWLHMDYAGVAATVTVTTDTPRYPVHYSGVTWHPVGTFTTTLAGPELTDAADRGDIVAWHGGQVHQMGDHLMPWAQWVLAAQRGEIEDVPRVGVLACKSWGRSVIGKFASRSHTAEALGDAPRTGWHYEDAYNVTERRPGAVVDMAGRRWHVTYDTDPDNAYPAVLAWVESHVRLRLGRVLDRLGVSWVSANTDGIIVDLARISPQGAPGSVLDAYRHRDPQTVAERLCARIMGDCEPLVLRVKSLSATLDVWGPAQLVTDGVVHAAGIHHNAKRVGERSFVGRDWPKLSWQMQHGDAAGYVRPPRETTMTGPLVHRWVTPQGDALPVRMSLGADGRNRIESWSETGHSLNGHVRAAEQYRALQNL
jgi:hypothetical protein